MESQCHSYVCKVPKKIAIKSRVEVTIVTQYHTPVPSSKICYPKLSAELPHSCVPETKQCKDCVAVLYAESIDCFKSPRTICSLSVPFAETILAIINSWENPQFGVVCHNLEETIPVQLICVCHKEDCKARN